MSEKILATVGTLTITEREVNEFIARLGQRGAAYRNPQGEAVILEELISQQLLLADAKKNLLEYEEAFKAQLARMKDRMLVDYAIQKVIFYDKVGIRRQISLIPIQNLACIYF